MKRYDKLVRDGIPAILEGAGKRYAVTTLSEAEYRERLCDKLDEEAAEYRASRDAEELADLLEVIYACAATQGVTPAQLEALRARKAQARGGFDARALLLWVDEGETASAMKA